MWWLPFAFASPYAELQDDLEVDRKRIAALPSDVRRDRARARLLWAVREELVPAWLGTTWAFHGTSTVPGEGTIACGYFVSTVLQHAGLQVERVRMAQQASEYIVRSFAPAASIRRFRAGDVQAVVADTLTRPDGLYVVGMDFHVGLLVKRHDEVEFCHASFLGPAEVVCGDPRTDPGFVSRYHVVGPVTSDRVVDAWLAGHRIPTVLPGD
jgi:hypothetical protein